jgi:hypothetical protein
MMVTVAKLRQLPRLLRSGCRLPVVKKEATLNLVELPARILAWRSAFLLGSTLLK